MNPPIHPLNFNKRVKAMHRRYFLIQKNYYTLFSCAIIWAGFFSAVFLILPIV